MSKTQDPKRKKLPRVTKKQLNEFAKQFEADIKSRVARANALIKERKVDDAVRVVYGDDSDTGIESRIRRMILTAEFGTWLGEVAREKLGDARLMLRVRAPYTRALLTNLTVREVWGMSTIGVTNNGVLVYDPAWLAQYTPEEISGLLMHECMHLMMRHPTRRGSRDICTFNEAGDLAINPAVKAMGLKLPATPGLTLKGTDRHTNGLDPKALGWPENLTADEYYERLMVEIPQQKGSGSEGGGKGDQGQADQTGTGRGNSDPKDKGSGDQPGAGDSGGGGDQEGKAGGPEGSSADNPVQPDTAPGVTGGRCGSCAGGSDNSLDGEEAVADEAGRTERDFDKIMSEVAKDVQEHAKNRGNVPAFLKRWAESSLEPPKIPWQQKLSHAVRRACNYAAGHVTPRYTEPNRRQNAIGWGHGKPILPTYRRPVPQVAIIVDTSGSMSPSDLGACLRECAGVLEAVSAEVQFCACDAQVNSFKKVNDAKEVAELLRGGGGTDFRPPLKAVSEAKPKPEVVIFMTDGCGPAPTKAPRGMEVVWLLVGHSRQKPWAVADEDPGYSGGRHVNYGTFVEVED